MTKAGRRPAFLLKVRHFASFDQNTVPAIFDGSRLSCRFMGSAGPDDSAVCLIGVLKGWRLPESAATDALAINLPAAGLCVQYAWRVCGAMAFRHRSYA